MLNSYRNTLQNSNSSMNIRYKNLIGDEYNQFLYENNLNDKYRQIISRWRLSSIPIKIETLRYTKPITPRSERKCTTCAVIEDEQHILFECTVFMSIRHNYSSILSRKNSVKSLLNPNNISDVYDVANYLQEIETHYKNIYVN